MRRHSWFWQVTRTLKCTCCSVGERQLIKAVFFDFGGTLAVNNKSFEDFFVDGLAHFSIDATKEQLKRVFVSDSMMPIKRLVFKDDEEGVKDFWNHVYLAVWEVFGKNENGREFAQHMWKAHLAKDSYDLYDDTKAVLDVLESRGIPLGILSNFDKSILDKLEYLELKKYFKYIYCSSGLGFSKPNPEAFLSVCKLSGFQPNEILYVGDDVENDYHPCVAIGIRSVIIDRGEGKLQPKSSVRSLLDILPMLNDH